MNLLKDLRMSLLNFSFIMIFTIYKISALLQTSLNFLKDSIFECSFKEYNRPLIFSKQLFFFITYNYEKFKS